MADEQPQGQEAEVNDQQLERQRSLEEIARLGVDPYPHKFARTHTITEIVREFDRLLAAEERRLAVELTTAYDLSDDEASGILEQIEKASGRKVEASRQVDPNLIGGFVLQAGSMRVDASVRGRIERLRHELVKRS